MLQIIPEYINAVFQCDCHTGAKDTISKALVRLLRAVSFKSVNGKDGEGGGEKEDITIP